MMKRFSYGLLLCALALLSSCRKEAEEPEWDGPVIELELSCLSASGFTKAGTDGEQSGENSYHENALEWVDFYFYPGGATSEPATFHVRKESGKRESDVFRLFLTTNQVNYLIFPVLSGIEEATVFAIANGPKTLLDGLTSDQTSMDHIQSLAVSSDFVTVHHTNRRQDQFMMSGTTTLNLSGRSQKVVSQGLVKLSRYASKITVGVKMDDYVEVDTGRTDDEDLPIKEVWTPRLEEMKVYLVDGINKVLLNGETAGEGEGDAFTPEDDDYFTYGDAPLTFCNTNGDLYLDKEGDYYQTFPMYTYPYHWSSGSTDVGSREPYLKLVLSWDRAEDLAHHLSAIQKEYYYKIPIPEDRRGGEYLNSFVRNNWYHYDISVGVLGSDTDDADVELSATMYIVDWQNKVQVVKHANIGSPRYLSVEKEEYILYNQNSIDVRYTTSSRVTLENIHVTRPYYGSDNLPGETEDYKYSEKYGADVKRNPNGGYYLEFSEDQRKALNNGEDWLEDQGGVVYFSHAINNQYTTDTFDYSPYTIEFDVTHADISAALKPEYTRHVKIVQNPGLFIEATPNPDTWTGVTGATTPDHWGYVYVNNDQYTRARYDVDNKGKDDAWRLDHIWRVVHYSSGGTDMFRIDVSVLSNEAEFDFVLGDPRQSTVDNLRTGYEEYFATAPAIEGGERSLTWYYPTEASDRTVNMLAPAYRVSTKLSGSEYGGTPMEQAKMRCASFQENGFPAGRWRLPTEGEIRFISNLSAHGVFEWQFSGNYWSANGAVNVDKDKKTVTKSNVAVAMLRCVYDSWYWGDDRVLDSNGLPTIFTWGDAQR